MPLGSASGRTNALVSGEPAHQGSADRVRPSLDSTGMLAEG